MANPISSDGVVWIVVTDPTVRQELTDGVSAAGLQPVEISVPEAPSKITRESLTTACKDAARNQPPSLVLVSLVSPSALSSAAISDLSPAQWTEQAEAPIYALFHVLQSLLAALEGQRFSIAVIGPTIGNVGAPGLVPLSVSFEAQRGVMKSVARQVGDRGITLNWIGVEPVAYAARLAQAEIAHGPEMGPPGYALGRIPSLRADVARTVALFANGGAAAFTGASINIDGGEWMQP